jgi:hypothetical protein
MICKRHAPWPIEKDTFVESNGNVHLARTYPFLNGYCPALLVGLRCNIDTKFNTNGEETRDATWYCAGYQVKHQDQSHNLSALLAKGFMFHKEHQRESNTSIDNNRLLIYRCFNSLNQRNELSGPEVMSYLMGWGDVFRSHHYTPLYWSRLARLVKEMMENSSSSSQDPSSVNNLSNFKICQLITFLKSL